MDQLRFGCLVIFFFFATNEARNKPPLSFDGGYRGRNKAAECTFGDSIRELGSQWIPDLGVPFGVLYCMRCECEPVQRKRRIVGKVHCRNIQNECPRPTCDEPVVLPERCCKTCPGDLYNPDMSQDIIPQSTADEEEKGPKHFAALLTGKSSLILKNDYLTLTPNDVNKNKVVATGRFSFHKRNLHYSFYISDKAARPRSLQFIDNEGNILEEFTLSTAGGLVNSLYQNSTRKVCGVWNRLPRSYRRYLKQERMYVALVWGVKDHAETEFSISGQVTKYAALSKEVLSSLLEPAQGSNPNLMSGTGGTAIISISTTFSPSIHIAIIFNGLFTSNEISEVPVNITLLLDNRRIILKENVLVRKPSSDLNLVEISSPVAVADLRLLTRGRLVLSLSSVSHPTALRLSGSVTSKASCEIFQATLSSGSERNPYGTSGLAWLYLNNEGSLVYNIQVDNMISEVTTTITLIDVSTRRKTELEDLTPFFINGWANGTVEKLSPKVLEPLYSGDLAVNVATSNANSLIRGKLTAIPVGDARDAAAPVLLKRQNNTLPPSVVGIGWMAVDNDCHFHFDVTITGLGGGEKKLELYLELLPMLAPGAPNITKRLASFQGNHVDGGPVEVMAKEELIRLDSGAGFLKVKNKESGITLLSANFNQVKVPPTCRPPYTDNNVPTGPLLDNSDSLQSGDCFHEGKFYQEEAQWTSTSDPCTMCFCQNGKEKCDTMTCPEPNCPPQHRIKPSDGDCCPICFLKNNVSDLDNRKNLPQKCIFNGKSYFPGSKFHPFLIPNGFDLCTECVCDPYHMDIKCSRQKNEELCCKNCQKTEPPYPNDELPPVPLAYVPKKELATKPVDQVLREGGCKNLYNSHKPFENGTEYHPFIDSLGEYKCVICKCNNGTQDCKRLPCEKKACEKKRKRQRAESCCSAKECRKYKHRRNHRVASNPSS